MVMPQRILCSCSMRHTLISAFIIWTLIFIYLSVTLFGIQFKEKDMGDEESVALDYERALLELLKLKQENDALRNLLNSKENLRKKNLEKQGDQHHFNSAQKLERRQSPINREKRILDDTLVADAPPQHGFSMNHEMARRALHNSIRELYYYLNNQFNKHKNLSFENHTRNQMLSLLGQSAAFGNIDSAEIWRTEALANISATFQNFFEKMQNPDDCQSARILICNLNKQCGFGCQLHHVTYCFIVAYGSNRTLVLAHDGRFWNYAVDGWNSAFLPITKCSFYQIFKPGEEDKKWATDKRRSNMRILTLPIVDSLFQRPPYLPLAIPLSFSEDLLKLHSNPPVFFISQFIRYLMRPSTMFAERIEQAAMDVPFDKGPIVGLHIRRTDKIGTEAAFHDLNEYMKWTEEWFQIEEYRTGMSFKRRIYIATDDPNVFHEATLRYSNYEIYGDSKIADTAQLNSRYSMESLIGVVVDIELLARCSYLVCTFSSQVCRMSYELMQIRVGDAGDQFHSLDDIYYYGGQQDHEQEAIESYRAERNDEIDLEIGDVIAIAGNHWDGFSKGTNWRTGRKGLYPSYKVREKYIIVKFP